MTVLPKMDLVPSEAVPVAPEILASRRQSAWRGALTVGAPGLLMVWMIPVLYGGLFPMLWNALHALAPGIMAPYLALGLLFCFPALLALPLALLGAMAARQQARRGRDRGLAAAAGAGIAATAVTAGSILFHAGSPGALVLQAPLFAAAALAVGVVGGFSFAAVPAAREGDEEHGIPSLYQGLMAAGLGGPALLAGGAAWAGLAWMVPWLSPRMVETFLASPLAEAATVIVALGGLAPLTWGLARGLRNLLPGARGRALAMGLLFPTLIPLLGLLGLMITRGSWSPIYFAMLAGCLLGALPHALAIVLGLRRTSPGPARIEGPALSRAVPSLEADPDAA